MLGKYLQTILVFAVVNAQTETVYKKPEIYSLSIVSDIAYRYATTLVTSRVKNPSDAPREAIFNVMLPNEAFITNMTIEEAGEIIVGDVKEKEEARQQYEEAQRRGESAGYIANKPRETNQFQMAVTVAAHSKVTFNLTYQQLLTRRLAHYEQVLYIDPGQPVPEMDVIVRIKESRNITKLRVPPLRNDIGAELLAVDSLAVIERLTAQSAVVRYSPSVDQQLAQSETGVAGQFVVQYDVERGADAGEVMVVDGYFVHFFAPEGLDPIPSDVLFILDVSGSMAGTKLKQLKEAMHVILDEMNARDRINIMTFSKDTNLWQDNLIDVSGDGNVERAHEAVDAIKDRGSTNINLALTSGIHLMSEWERQRHSQTRSPVIVFLTDGQATSGVTSSDQILENIRNKNIQKKVSIFCLAFGNGADFILLKKIAIQNGGFAKKIYEASDAALQISGFYNEIALTILKDLSFNYLEKPVSNLTKHFYENYFAGSELIVSGVIDDYDATLSSNDMVVRVESKGVHGSSVLVVDGVLVLGSDSQPGFDSHLAAQLEGITEKVWAYLTIKQLLNQELVATDQAQKDALNERILQLSLQYGFVTPLTAMVVTKQTTNIQDEESQYEGGDAMLASAGMMDPSFNPKIRPQGAASGSISGASGPAHQNPMMQLGLIILCQMLLFYKVANIVEV